MGHRKDSYRVLVGTLEGRRSLERPRRRWDVDGRTILKWILDKWDGGNGLDRPGSRQE